MLLALISKIGRAIQHVEEILLSCSILIIAGLTILNVICRSLFGFSLAFTEEVSQFCIIVVCFVGLSYAASKGRHIRMTAIYNQLPPRSRKVLMVVITTSTATFLLMLSWYALCYVMTVYELGGIYPTLRVPFYVVYAIAPIGLLMAGVQYGLAATRNLMSPGTYVSYEQKDEHEVPVTQEI